MPKRSYTSTPEAGGAEQDVASTEGITFDLDGIEFTCHGRISMYDISAAAGSLTSDGIIDDPDAIPAIADLIREVLGADTYRAFTRHRRAHRTPDMVVQDIINGVIEETGERATGRPTVKPPTSPDGPTLTPVSSAATGQPAAGKTPANWTMTGPSQQPPAAEQTIPPEVARGGDIRMVPEPGSPEPDPAYKTKRVINIGDGSRTRVEPAVS